MDTGIIEMVASLKVDDKWFLMGHQFCYGSTETLSVQVRCKPACYKDMVHYVVECGDVTYKIRSDYAVEVEEMKDRAMFDRQQYAINERLGGDTTTDFVAQAKDLLGIDIHRYGPDIALDPELEKKLGYR
jgi:glycyl-tRNA synthetase (class II)